MSLTKKDVTHIAHLSRLSLTDGEIGVFTEQISSVLSYVKTLDEVETDHVAPTAQVTGLTNVVRSDAVHACTENMRNNLLAQAKVADTHGVMVPIVFD